MVTFGEPLEHVIILRGKFLWGVRCVCVWCGTLKTAVCRSQHASVCMLKTSPCVVAPRPHVLYMWTWCRYTHGDVLNRYMEAHWDPHAAVFQRATPHIQRTKHTHTHTPHTKQTNKQANTHTHHNTTTTQHHNTTTTQHHTPHRRHHTTTTPQTLTHTHNYSNNTTQHNANTTQHHTETDTRRQTHGERRR